MSTNKAVRAAWKEQVFDKFRHINSYDHRVLEESDQTSNEKGYSNEIVDHFTYEVSSVEIPEMTCQRRLDFKVEITRRIADDPQGANFNVLQDDFRLVQDYVHDNLGISWDNTIDLSTNFPEEIEAELITWGSVPSWEATLIFTGTKHIDI